MLDQIREFSSWDCCIDIYQRMDIGFENGHSLFTIYQLNQKLQIREWIQTCVYNIGSL